MIHIFETGGTFGKVYDDGKGVMNFSFSSLSPIPEILTRMRFTPEYRLQSLLQKDSLEMTSADRRIILRACADLKTEDGSEPRMVVIHGTDTIHLSAKAIDAGLKRKRKSGRVVVLTGAAQPASMRDTDAEMNLAFALAAVQTLRKGVYIAMNGIAFPWRECQKGDNGVFHHKSSLD